MEDRKRELGLPGKKNDVFLCAIVDRSRVTEGYIDIEAAQNVNGRQENFGFVYVCLIIFIR